MQLKDQSRDELEQLLIAWGQPPYRAAQLWHWMYRKSVRDFEEMTDLPVDLRRQLSQRARLDACWVRQRREDPVAGTVKYAMALSDGLVVEAVALRYRDGVTACLSSQAGCRMGCSFCASGKSWERQLTSGEIIDQFLRIGEDLGGRRSSRVVLMGTGEPLDNYEAVLQAVRRLHDGTGMSYRSFTISTCGLVPGILKLAAEQLPINLAVSLHAVDDALRQRLMPRAARLARVDRLVAACMVYAESSGRRVTFEYLLLDGVNDRVEDARRLADLAGRVRAHVNLIPFNAIPGSPYRRSPPGRVAAFGARLREAGVAFTVRRELGAGIDAACGQLRQRGSGSEADVGQRSQ
ncbi:MAG TPA: 23S rRNA (adenine(2503)-C(2))-methyltransferase RlmN [Clostridiales bacterium UBA8153]|nr:23S rRNA (adenine(2503)-C(2))-methyltransferase RlmN [Clostridiales bacterium UBA8153]